MNDHANKTDVSVIDTTLRDGEQSAGVVFSQSEKISIAKALSDIGVTEIEAGTPAIGEFEVENLKALAGLKLDSRLIAWCRCYKHDIDAAYVTGIKAVHISAPVSTLHLRALYKNEDWMYENLRKQIRYAKKYFEFVFAGAQDASRSDDAVLRKFILIADEEKVDRIRIADTVGMLSPSRTFELIRMARSLTKIPLEYHGHNDLGMATANSLTAVQAGADCVSVTVNGIGERAGNTPLEEFVMALKHSSGLDSGINTAGLQALCEMVSRFSGIPIHENKPVTGSKIFRHESGIHCKGLLYDRNTYELFHPDETGRNEEDFVMGKHSGTAGLIHTMNKYGMSVSAYEAALLLETIKKHSVNMKRALTMDEVKMIYRDMMERNIITNGKNGFDELEIKSEDESVAIIKSTEVIVGKL
jgi:homocitrate synthase NifV